MNPAYTTQSHPAGTVVFQTMMHPVQHQSSTAVRYATVNVNSEPPKDHIIWSLCNFLYGNPLFLGLAALIFSIKARDRKMAGDMNGAKHFGATARFLNIWATILVSLMIIIIIVRIMTAIFAA